MMQRTALITGAGSGIGREAALYFAHKGYTVFAVGRTLRALEETAALANNDGQIIPLCADVTQPDSLIRILHPVKSLDILVINAGICERSALGAPQAEAVWHRVIQTNLTGSWNTIQATGDRLAAGAKVVFVSSGLGKLGRAQYTAYAASKHGILGMMRCLAYELAPRKISVNAVCPGWVDTSMAQADLATSAHVNQTTPHAESTLATAAIPLGRFVFAAEVATLIGWLCSDDASAITGQAYNISGGEFGL